MESRGCPRPSPPRRPTLSVSERKQIHRGKLIIGRIRQVSFRPEPDMVGTRTCEYALNEVFAWKLKLMSCNYNVHQTSQPGEPEVGKCMPADFSQSLPVAKQVGRARGTCLDCTLSHGEGLKVSIRLPMESPTVPNSSNVWSPSLEAAEFGSSTLIDVGAGAFFYRRHLLIQSHWEGCPKGQ